MLISHLFLYIDVKFWNWLYLFCTCHPYNLMLIYNWNFILSWLYLTGKCQYRQAYLLATHTVKCQWQFVPLFFWTEFGDVFFLSLLSVVIWLAIGRGLATISPQPQVLAVEARSAPVVATVVGCSVITQNLKLITWIICCTSIVIHLLSLLFNS